MKVFISWSGDYSREVAEKLRVWIPSVIQSVEPFFSPDDIGKGENWDNVLSRELGDCNFGIICLTPENVTAPWIHFEAGALAKALKSRLSSVMFGINPSDVKGPLSRFQNTKFEREDFFKLLQSINGESDHPLKPEILSNSFDALWERLDKEIKPIIKKYEGAAKPPKVLSKTTDSDAIQEILSIVRKMSNSTLSDKGIETVNIEFPRNNLNKTVSESIVHLGLLFAKIGPTLSDKTKRILSKYLPSDVSDRAISSLEDHGTFSHFLYTSNSTAEILVDKFSNVPDLYVKHEILLV